MQPTELIVIAGLIADRERKGPKWCEKWGIGKRRRIVGVAFPIAEANGSAVSIYAGAQRGASTLLAAECRRCGLCKMAEQP